MMDNDRNSWQYLQTGSAGSCLTGTGGNEEVLQSPTIPHYSVPNSDWQTLEEERQELEPPSTLPADPYASRYQSDLEDHQCYAFSLGLFESIENAIPSTNWKFSTQFREEESVDLNENSDASPESWKNFPVAGDGDVETASGLENLGMFSRDTQGPLPKRNHTTAARIAQNQKTRRNQNKIDGVKRSAGRRQRGPNWTVEENRSFLQLMEVQKGKSPWKAISESLKAMGFVREAKACEDHWGVILADLTKFENHFGSDNILGDLHFWPNVGTMSREQRSQNGLPLMFEEEWFEAIARIVKERSTHRKSRRECSEGKIHVGGTPSSSSCRQQSRVSAASATPSLVAPSLEDQIYMMSVPMGMEDQIYMMPVPMGMDDQTIYMMPVPMGMDDQTTIELEDMEYLFNMDMEDAHECRVGDQAIDPITNIFRDFPQLSGGWRWNQRIGEASGSGDRNLTTDQTIEVMRIRLEAQKMDLRKLELEFERDRMHMYHLGKTYGLTEKARCPLAAHERPE